MREAEEFCLAEPITFEIDCHVGDDRENVTRHPITVNPDWSVVTPHDMEVERIAAAFGSRMSCLELDKSIKAVQRFIKINQRREFVPVEHLYASEWRLDGHYFPSVYAAAAHARSAQFAASREIAHDWQTRQVAEGIRWWTADRLDIEQFDANHPWVREYNGLRRLWHAGIHPTAIRRLRELLGSPPTALSVSDYIAAAYSGSPPRFQRSK
ncbi:hypothetical protein [uncultured Gordonia sp.]|nr:hypothetical protein [uncultured Gordonia sp.]